MYKRQILDRFCSVKLQYQSKEDEIRIVKSKTSCDDEWLIEFAVEVVRRTRMHPDLRMGASVRGAIDMVLIAQNLKNLGYDGLELVREAAITGLRNKVWVSEASEKDADEIISEVVTELYLERTGIEEHLKKTSVK